MKAASTISVRDSHAIVKAGEFIEARFGAGTSPSLAARKTLALLIAKAAGEAWRPGSHVIAKRELRGTHNANDRIQDTLDELMDVKFQMPSTSAQGRAATLTAALLAWTLNEHAEDGRATVEWEFTAPAVPWHCVLWPADGQFRRITPNNTDTSSRNIAADALFTEGQHSTSNL